MVRGGSKQAILGLVLVGLMASTAAAGALWQPQTQDQKKVPDAPSAVRPPQPVKPDSFPAAGSVPSATPNPDRVSPPNGDTSAPPVFTAPDQQVNTPPRSGGDAPQPPVKPGSAQEEMFTLVKDVNFITVPVTVKDGNGHLVEGLTQRDFSMYEDGVAQTLRLFTSDPFALSVALVIDNGMSDVAMRRVNDTLGNLGSAFGPYDEVALFSYGSTVHKASEFGAAGDGLSAEIRRIKRPGRTGGVPVVSGPMAAGPTVNGHPLDPGAPRTQTVRHESHVLNDAILAAAQELSSRDRSRRRIIFLISDGQEEGSDASYNDVLKVLLSHGITVYAVGVDTAAIPGYKQLGQLKLPRFGQGNILSKYVSATGGDEFAEFTRDSIEAAYARLTEVARNQYTLGYTTRVTAASNYRTIEVRVRRPGLRVYARDGYYPLPPQRRPAP